MIVSTERATPHGFFEEGYLLANADIADHVKNGGDALTHLKRYGVNEGRKQVTRDFLDYRRGDGPQQKYERFKHIFDGSELRFLQAKGSFPISFAKQHYTLSDYAGESANASYAPFVDEIRANPNQLYMDLSCGMRDVLHENCLYLEVYPSLCADVIVEPNNRYPIESGSLDGIGCFAVLEHVSQPWVVAQEIHRMLKPGGVCMIDWPFLQPVHGYPSHYYNATREGLREMFSEGFEIVRLGTERSQNPAWTINWILGNFIEKLPPAEKRKLSRMTVGELLEQHPKTDFWQSIMAQVPDDVVSEFSCGNTLIATKKTR